MYLLDNNILELFLDGNPAVMGRFSDSEGVVYLSSVAAEEHIVNLLSTINRARAPRTSLSLTRAHQDFTNALRDLNRLPILAYDKKADLIFKTFSASVIRIGAQDCRIAAQALAHGLTVVTRNLRDFEAIGAPCTDWSV